MRLSCAVSFFNSSTLGSCVCATAGPHNKSVRAVPMRASLAIVVSSVPPSKRVAVRRTVSEEALYSSLSAALGEAVGSGRLDGGVDPADSGGGRGDDGAVSRDAIGAQRLPALFSHAASRRADRPRAAGADLHDRLRPR